MPLAEAGILEVDVPMNDKPTENFLEVYEVGTGKLVTILELLSPANKLHDEGRRQYEQKRDSVFRTGRRQERRCRDVRGDLVEAHVALRISTDAEAVEVHGA